MEIRVKVTQEDLDKGDPRNPCRCALALAVVRALPPGATMTCLNADGLEIFSEDENVEGDWAVTDEATWFMDAFDDPALRPALTPCELLVVAG